MKAEVLRTKYQYPATVNGTNLLLLWWRQGDRRERTQPAQKGALDVPHQSQANIQHEATV